jgi:hypothetical protein
MVPMCESQAFFLLSILGKGLPPWGAVVTVETSELLKHPISLTHL